MQSQSNVRVPQQRTSKETELERLARRERESWDRFRRGRKEEGIKKDGREEEEAILINGERYVKQGSQDRYSHREIPRPSPPSVATESTSNTGDGQDPIWQRLRDLLERTISLGNNLTASSAKPKENKGQEEEGGKIKTEPTSTRLLGLFSSLSFGNESVPPRPSASFSHSRCSRGSNREQPSSRNHPTKNTVEAIADANACPNPYRQASRERQAWEKELPSGVEYVERPATSPDSRNQASYHSRYPRAPTAVTVSESDVSSHYQPKTETENQTHPVYRVPSYRMDSTPDSQPQQRSAAPAANTRRRRRRGLSEELSTVAENGGTSAHGHDQYL